MALGVGSCSTWSQLLCSFITCNQRVWPDGGAGMAGWSGGFFRKHALQT